MESLGQELDQWLNSLEEALALMGEEIDNDREAIGGTVRDAAEKRGRLADRVSTLEKRLESIKGFAYESHDEDIEKLKATTEHIKRVHNKSLDREDDKHRKIQADIDDAARRVHDEIHALKKTTEQNRELHNNVVTHVTNRFNNLETELICLTDELRHYKASNNKEMRRNRTPIHIAIAVASGALVLHLLHGAWVAWLLTG